MYQVKVFKLFEEIFRSPKGILLLEILIFTYLIFMICGLIDGFKKKFINIVCFILFVVFIYFCFLPINEFITSNILKLDPFDGIYHKLTDDAKAISEMKSACDFYIVSGLVFLTIFILFYLIKFLFINLRFSKFYAPKWKISRILGAFYDFILATICMNLLLATIGSGFFDTSGNLVDYIEKTPGVRDYYKMTKAIDTKLNSYGYHFNYEGFRAATKTGFDFSKEKYDTYYNAYINYRTIMDLSEYDYELIEQKSTEEEVIDLYFQYMLAAAYFSGEFNRDDQPESVNLLVKQTEIFKDYLLLHPDLTSTLNINKSEIEIFLNSVDNSKADNNLKNYFHDFFTNYSKNLV